jgi:gluconate 2-dehydrogenase gamma chain
VNPAYQLSRRKFLEAALLAAAAAGSGAACATSSPWRFLTVEQARTLAAGCDCVIPPDEDPGAAWAGVVNFIDRQLCGPLRDSQNAYRLGIAAMNQGSRLIYGRDFASLPEEKRVELLVRMEKGESLGAAWQKISSTEFLSMLVDHTMQGFYGDPRHGGNRDRASWKMVGLSYPPIRGRLQYDISKS